ncbi:MAG: FAD-binding oxidoreductase [Elusimicrobia bacterium]|nr:FAD-binding oxidoreductase [Elusimicrobiota bacterium]
MIELKENFERYLEDESSVKGQAEKVIIPENENEISEIFKFSQKEKIPVTISGGRTGVTGGAVPERGIVISSEKLKKIEFDEKQQILKVQAGVFLSEIEDFLKKTPFFYPPDPTEKLASFGGTVATDASGARGFFYRRTRNYIKKLKVILPDGEIFECKRGEFIEKDGFLKIMGKKVPCANFKMPDVKNSAGYYSKKGMDAVDLFVGSEGTLGFIFEAEVKLIPQENFTGILVFFTDYHFWDVLNFLKNKKQKIVSIEFFDENSLKLLKEDFPQIPSSKSAIFFEIKGEDFEFVEKIEKFKNIKEIFVAEKKREKEFVKNLRHRLPEKINEIVRLKGFTKVASDFAVKDENFKEMFKLHTKAKDEKIPFVLFGHIGESHLHLNFLPEKKEDFEKSKVFIKKLAQRIIKMSGTITAEHGVGRTKKELFYMMFSEKEIEKMLLTKKSLDRQMLLNRGVMFQE